jgi:hypothetical protein
MDTRILRMAERCKIGGLTRYVRGMGQLQPVLFFIKDGEVCLRIEGVADRWGSRTWCYWTFHLSDKRQKAEAKKLFAEVEACKREGRPTEARRLWDEYCAKRDAKLAA